MDKTINQNLIVKGSLTADRVITQKKDEPIGKIIMGTGNNFATQSAVQNVYIGTWEQIKDVFLLAAGDTYVAGTTGGEAQHTLTVSELPKNIGQFNALSWASHNADTKGAFGVNQLHTDKTAQGGNDFGDALFSLSGGGNAHNNLPPYLVVYMWRRIA